MRIRLKFALKSWVRNKLSEDILMVTEISIQANGNYRYGCMNAKGDNEWYEEYELESVRKDRRLGFEIEVL